MQGADPVNSSGKPVFEHEERFHLGAADPMTQAREAYLQPMSLVHLLLPSPRIRIFQEMIDSSHFRS